MNISDYKFNVGDEVVTIDGVKGIIIGICECCNCKERGFFEPEWLAEDDIEAEDIKYITIYDANTKFYDYHKIGKYQFNNFNKDLVLSKIAQHEKEIQKLESQLRVIEEITELEKGERTE